MGCSDGPKEVFVGPGQDGPTGLALPPVGVGLRGLVPPEGGAIDATAVATVRKADVRNYFGCALMRCTLLGHLSEKMGAFPARPFWRRCGTTPSGTWVGRNVLSG